MREVVIIRPKRFNCAAVKMDVYVDNRIVGTLKNGKSVTLNVDENAHEIKVKGGFFMPKSFSFQMMIPDGIYSYCFQVDFVTYDDTIPVLRPTDGTFMTDNDRFRTVLGVMIMKKLLSPSVRSSLKPETLIQVLLTEEKWQLVAFEKDQSYVIFENLYQPSDGYGVLLTILNQTLDQMNYDTPEHRHETVCGLYNTYLKYLPDFEIVEGNMLRFKG